MLTADTDATPLGHADGHRPFDLEPVLAALLPVVMAQQGDLLTVKDAVSGRYLYVNHAMAALLERAPAHVIGLSDNELFDAQLAAIFRAADLTAQGSSEPALSEHRFEWAGLRRDFSVLRVLLERGERAFVCAVWRDQGAQRLKEAQLRGALDQLEREQRANEALRREIKEQGLRETHSGLYTRAHFEDQLRREVDLSMREQREFALVLIDIDPWSDSVRQRGEPAQLKVVEALGKLLRSNTRAMDASCHLDGSRFAVLLSGVGLATAHGRMEQLRRQCATQIVMLDAQELHFSVSIGVASFPHTAHTRDQLLLAAEQAVVAARSRGNHVSLASIRLED
ncbi:MAG: diguanylate cyclase [Rubrivivax sp.]|nr:diguanylate cyclase [Rubrivivax sp.]